jgi:hypothetical protein
LGLNTYQWEINRIWFSIKVLNKYQNKSKTNKEKTKQNVKNKNKTKIIIHSVTFRGIVNLEKIYCDFFSCDFFSTDATHTYDIILNTDTISILIPYSQWWAKNRERKIFPQKRKTIRFIIFVNGFRYTVAILLNAGLI